MNDVVIVNLELLTPLKYEKFIMDDSDILNFYYSENSPSMFEVVKVYQDVYKVSNIKDVKASTSEIREYKEKAEKCTIISSQAIRAFEGCLKKQKRIKFTGLHGREENDYCALQYRVTNYNDDIKLIFNACDPEFIVRMKNTYVVSTGLEDKTIGTFKDMFDEL
jgi:hypothetical protein